MDGQRQDTQNGVSMERELTAGERFALQKEKAGGFKQLQTELKKTSWFVFTEEGEIQYKGITKPDMRKYKGSKSIEINNSEILISMCRQAYSQSQRFLVEVNVLCENDERAMDLASGEASREKRIRLLLRCRD